MKQNCGCITANPCRDSAFPPPHAPPTLIVLTRRNTFQAFRPQIRYLLGLAILPRLSLSDSDDFDECVSSFDVT